MKKVEYRKKEFTQRVQGEYYMKLYLFDQQNKLQKHLDLFKSNGVMVYDKSKLIDKTTSIVVNTTKTIDQLNIDFLFDYNIFPESIMSFKSQWDVESRKMKVGDTIAQQIYIPPIKYISQKIIVGVRIAEIIDEPNRKGFSYETLEGHVERGISTFTIEQIQTSMVFAISTYSSPGNILTKLLGPILSIPYQSYCTNLALKNVKQQLER